ncbi:hypothetical protein CHS0354_001662 [Potamilus streckersoni]|uniref:Uncharacterized protein n=1 Tax=Potamilus streckersoni TaxID=2493646 RepID=A0AAE0RU02_9BIVA|nr:hypothetical protein CHS0354_001662 [Potamilus streckersoni]
MTKLKAFTGGKENPGGRYAIVSMKNPETGEIYYVSFMSINDIRNANLRPVPLDPDLRPLEVHDANVRPDANVQHAEQAMGVYDDTFDLIDTFLLDHENQENVRDIFLDLFKDKAMGENRYNSIYKTDFGKKNYAFSNIERQQLTTVWTDVNKLPDKITNIRDLKESIQESFNTKFGETLKKIEVDTMEKYMQDVNSFLKANHNSDDRTLNIELFRNIEDKNLQKKLKDWYKKGKPENLDDFKTEIRTTITEHFDLIRGFKTEYSSKAFSTYLDDTLGEAISRVLLEELAIKKTVLELEKITNKEFIEFVHLT